MEKKYLIINLGSSSKKYALYLDDKQILYAHFDKFKDVCNINIKYNKKELNEKQPNNCFDNALEYLLEKLIKINIIQDIRDIHSIGIRVVAPGIYFQKHRVIDKDYIKRLEELEPYAPLHIKPTLLELKNIDKLFKKIKIIGVSDSAFHSTIQKIAKNYAIDNKIASQFEIFKYGYHGISLSSIMYKIHSFFNQMPKKIIICHLGSGCSITAIKNGISIDTSMGFTPTEGIFSSTRTGDIDPGAVIYLGKKLGLSLDELEEYINSKCGLIGLTGKFDFRDVLNLSSNNEDAKLAIDMFVYRIKKYIGSYFAALNGLDLIIFSGAIGERSVTLRNKICNELECFDVEIDNKKNKLVNGKDRIINTQGSKVKILVINTDEMNEMQKQLKMAYSKT